MFLIASNLDYKSKDQNSVRIPHKISNQNGILRLIDKYSFGNQCLLIIANDPGDYANNDDIAKVLGKAFTMTNRKFKQVKVLDDRTRVEAEQLIENADLIFMCGGEILRQLEFLQQINFKRLIKNYQGLVITVSAASMCLTKTICNFPEHEKELSQPRLLNGLGMVDIKLIPHFDGETLAYQGTSDFPNLVEDYILPLSDDMDLCALPNGSFILYGEKQLEFFGPYYQINHRKVSKFTNE